MDKRQLINEILPIEWEMFHNVNGEDRADCQQNKLGFEALRTAQYAVWSEEALASYLEDIKAVRDDGRNIVREKYIRMMKSTSPAQYELAKAELPPVSEKKEAIVEEIWQIALPQTIKIREEYPKVGGAGRPLTSADERNGATSVETYQKGELLTYSEKTLELLLSHIRQMQAEGREFFREVQENSIRCMGYESMAEAEKLQR